jgi:hypothetical protein
VTRSSEAALPAMTFTVSLRARRFAFFPGHCELVFPFAKQSQRFLAASRLGMTGQKSHCEVVVSFPKQSQKLLSRNRIASLRSQRRRKRPSGCLGPSALAMTHKKVSLQGRRVVLFFACELVVSSFPRSLRASFFRLAKQSHGIASLRSQ